VVDCAGVERFDLLGISQGAAVAVAYAVRHPERVRRMVLLGGYASGWRVRADPAEVERREAMMALARTGWGSDSPVYRQLFTGLYVPDASEQQVRWFNDMQRKSASPENAVKLQQVFATIDVRDLLPEVTVPTLVLHSRKDQAIPLEAGKAIADRIPGAKFVALDSRNHILLEEEPAWAAFVKELRGFLET
jgi:pimeloyl-ACP methyl ester carboxylesterase